MLAVDEEDEEYEYDDSSEDEPQQQRKSSVEEDELLPVEKEGDKESDRHRKKGRYSAIFFLLAQKFSLTLRIAWSVFLLFANELSLFHCSCFFCTCDKSRK